MSTNRTSSGTARRSTVTENKRKLPWNELVEKHFPSSEQFGVTCHIYSTKSETIPDETKPCACGRLRRQHSFTGTPQTQYINDEDFISKHVTNAPLSVYGELKNGARFIRCDMQKSDIIEKLCELIVEDVGDANKPKLLINCYGAEEYFRMNENLERDFKHSIAQVATTKGAWILTSGINKGVSKLIGQSLYHYGLINTQALKPTIIGLTSWDTVTDHTRSVLKYQAESQRHVKGTHMINVFGDIAGQNSMLSENEDRTLDKYHSHFILLDKGCTNNYLSVDPRSNFVKNMREITECYTITIIVEGGFNTFDVILNDLKAKRPVIIVEGSGGLADILVMLLRMPNNLYSTSEPDYDIDVSALHSSEEHSDKEIIDCIRKIFHPDNDYRRYLYIYELGRGDSLANIIFRAVHETQIKSNQLLTILKLAVSWNCIDDLHDLLKNEKEKEDYYPELFEQALEENQPVFVDYFLRYYHNPLRTSDLIKNKEEDKTWIDEKLTKPNSTKVSMKKQPIDNVSLEKYILKNKVIALYAVDFIIMKLYGSIKDFPVREDNIPNTLIKLDDFYGKFIGPCAKSFYFKRNTWKRFRRDVSLYLCSKFTYIPEIWCTNTIQPEEKEKDTRRIKQLEKKYNIQRLYGKQEMLRDLFFWSVYVGNAEIAFVLLLRIKSRIGAALVATKMTQRLALEANSMDKRSKYREQAKEYEKYATECINACHSRNEERTCYLLLREISLFGHVTCMQIAIAARIKTFINTDIFDQVLNREWYGQLDSNTNGSWWSRFTFTVSLLTLGATASSLDYRPVDVNDKSNVQHEKENPSSKNDVDERARWRSVTDRKIADSTWYRKILMFHQSPIVKMFYHFLFYIWFLLVFSYMMLFEIVSEDDSIRWAEIYVIITVSAMLIEDIRKTIVEYYTQALERWHLKNSWILSLYSLPYILFYIGFGLYKGSKGRYNYFTAGRIVLAIDLEIWYLFSLRFVSAIKVLGPKLYMIRNMVRELMVFIYLIFICIVAYGVVSRSLFMYDKIEFTAQSVFTSIFYRPYWFLYGDVGDEKQDLDDIISSNTSTTNQVAEATVTHVLLTFHTLFINILLLNLLIALFGLTVQKDQDENEYYWRYQRYELVKDYFEKPLFIFPPLSLLIYIYLFFYVCIIRQGSTCRMFNARAGNLDDELTDFEKSATNEYARTVVESKYPEYEETWKTIVPLKSKATLSRTIFPSTVHRGSGIQLRTMTTTRTLPLNSYGLFSDSENTATNNYARSTVENKHHQHLKSWGETASFEFGKELTQGKYIATVSLNDLILQDEITIPKSHGSTINRVIIPVDISTSNT